jgi:NAD(P)-dependent dehydrogenase (short-subunit alcohol dehydrogenase family)
MRDATGRNGAASDALHALAETEGLSLHVIDLDVTDETSVEHAGQAVIERTGRIDILVNNAGFSRSRLWRDCGAVGTGWHGFLGVLLRPGLP